MGNRRLVEIQSLTYPVMFCMEISIDIYQHYWPFLISFRPYENSFECYFYSNI